MGLPGPDGNWKGYDLSDLSAKAAKFHGKNFFLIHGMFFIIFAFPGQTLDNMTVFTFILFASFTSLIMTPPL